MKKKTSIIIIASAFICLTALGLLAFFNSRKVSSRIMTCYNAKDESVFEVRLSDFTDFEWDSVIIYNNPVTQKDIQEITGINYDKELDLQSGMIFVKGNKVVYEEVFKTDFESLDTFKIYTADNGKLQKKINRFEKEYAVFNCEKIKSGNENRYVLKPKNQGTDLSDDKIE